MYLCSELSLSVFSCREVLRKFFVLDGKLFKICTNTELYRDTYIMFLLDVFVNVQFWLFSVGQLSETASVWSPPAGERHLLSFWPAPQLWWRSGCWTVLYQEQNERKFRFVKLSALYLHIWANSVLLTQLSDAVIDQLLFLFLIQLCLRL